MRQMRWVRLLVVIVMSTAAVVGYSKPRWLEPSQSAPATQLPQFGEADGFALVLFYGSDINGSLEDCGCPSHPAGGLARRAGYINAFKAFFTGVPVLQLDVGHFFSDKLQGDGKPTPEMLVKNGWVTRGYQNVQHDVANLSYKDLFYAQDLFEQGTYERHSRETPIIQQFVSANVRATTGTHVNPPAYVIKEVTGDRLPVGKDGRRAWRIGVIGVTEIPKKDAELITGFVVDDPLVASRRAVLEARAQSDLLVMLAYVSEDTAFKILDLNPEIDVVIAPRARWGRTYKGNHGRLVYADPQTKILGELRFYFDEAGHVSRTDTRQMLLDDMMPKDSTTEQLVTAAHSQIESTVKAWLTPKVNRPATPMAAGLFVTAETCGACHYQEFATWQQSAHAQAFATLEAHRQHFDAKCVGCHTTGYGTGGFQQILLTDHLANVQCESCHGPGQEHIADPLKPYGKVSTPQACQTCHTGTDSPAFNYATYWSKIQH